MYAYPFANGLTSGSSRSGLTDSTFFGLALALLVLDIALGKDGRQKRMNRNRLNVMNEQRSVRLTRPLLGFGITSPNRTSLQRVAQENERRRIAQELHDTLLQGFTGVALKLDAVTNTLPPALSKTKEQLQKLLAQMDDYLAEARRSIWKLRSTTFESTENFSGALLRASERAMAGTTIPLSFSVQGVERKLAGMLEDNLLRICEEAVANAVKHARPPQLEVTIEFNASDVQLRVRDTGCGFDPAGSMKQDHFGLLGMKERVKVLSGMLSIESAPGRGTSLWVILPTDGSSAAAHDNL